MATTTTPTTPNRRSGTYEPIIGNRNPTVITRTAHPGNSPAARNSSRQSITPSQAGIALQHGTYSNVTGKGVNSMKESRAQEKKDMQNLNERFATYIERVRFLEAQNKALQAELDKLRKSLDPTKIKDMYETELAQARNIIDELSKQKADMDVKLVSVEDQLVHEKAQTKDELDRAEDYKTKYEDALNKLHQLEADYNTLQDRCQNADDDYKAVKNNLQRVQDDNNRLRGDLDNETMAHINMANKCQSLEEEMAFITSVYEQEIRDLQALINRDDSGDLRKYWKGELSKAIREIQTEYDNRLDQMRNDMDSKYNNQIREIRAGQVNSAPPREDLSKEENKKSKARIMDLSSRLSELQARNAYLESQVQSLTTQMEDKDSMHDAEMDRMKGQITQLQTELESVLQEIQTLMDAKLNLELEIAAYRKLLDLEESRLNLKDVVKITAGNLNMEQDIVPKNKNTVSSAPMNVSESTGRVTVQRSSRGPLGFSEASPDGKYIIVENTSSLRNGKVQQLTGWKVRRIMADNTQIEYTFDDCELPPTGSIKIWSADSKGKKGTNDKCTTFSTWGVGNSTTYLYDTDGAEKATIVQKFIM